MSLPSKGLGKLPNLIVPPSGWLLRCPGVRYFVNVDRVCREKVRKRDTGARRTRADSAHSPGKEVGGILHGLHKCQGADAWMKVSGLGRIARRKAM